MRLPKDLLTQSYTKPRLFLCETDKTIICQLENTNMNGVFKFNSMSELSFDVSRVYIDTITGETKVNPFYDRIESPRLVYLEGFAYFELQAPEIVGDGNKEIKTCTAYSSEYTLSTKFLSNFYINTGEIDSVEVMYANNADIIPVTFYNPANKELSLLHLVLHDVRGWKIGHVDKSLQKMSRKFEVSRQSVYDFIMNEICDKFNCYVIFNTINNTINFYAESLTSKFIGDGKTNIFAVSPPFYQVGTVSVDGRKTTRWEYNQNTGELTLVDTPKYGVMIEVVDGALSEWETDVFVAFDNLAQEINITYDADSIKTVLNVTYGDDYTIREANLGLPYLMDLSYYHTPEWMGEDLYEAYRSYLQAINNAQTEYSSNTKNILELSEKISSAQNKTSIGYGVDHSVNAETIGTYYVISGGIYPNYTYNEVSLPRDYNANTVYYKLNGVNVTEEKVNKLYSAVRKYFLAAHKQYEPEIKDIAKYDGTWEELLDELTESFSFVASQFTIFKNSLKLETTVEDASSAFRNFLDLIWGELGATPLDKLFLVPYKEIQTVNVSAGYAQANNEHYWFYYPVTIMIESLESAISQRNKEIELLEEEKKQYEKASSDASSKLAMENYFTESQLVRLYAFMREDEVHFDDIVEIGSSSVDESFAIKQDAMENGRIELNKLCQPQLQFSMNMANIYALPEFEPIIDRFQLGNVIRVGLRSDYIKQSRLLEVNINFDNLSDFSCEFGELTSLRSQSDIHADLLSQAISAGKNVASNAPLWTSGADKANKTDLKIEQGLLDAVTQIKAIDGTQGAVIDKYGIKLQKQLEDGSIDPEQVWLVNNQFVFTDDNFKTARSALGKVTVDGNTYYGLISEIVLSGYIEGSKMVGGTIDIGDGAFMVDENGKVTMGGDSKIGNMTVQDVQNYLSNENNVVYTSCPTHGNYFADEIWIVGENDYIQTDENGNIVDSFGNIIAPISMGIVNDDKSIVTDTNGNKIGSIQNGLVIDDNNITIGVYDYGRNIASAILGHIQGGLAIDSNGTLIGEINQNIVTDQGNFVGLIRENYIISSEIIGTTNVDIKEQGSVLRSISDGNRIYKSTDWVSALEKYDTQHSDLSGRVNSIEGDLDQHFEFSNNNGLIIKDGNSEIYTRLRNKKWSFMQHDDNPLVGDAEVAYISDKKLYISSAEITGLDAEDGNLEVNGQAIVKKLRVENTKKNNSLVVQSEDNGSFSILIQTQGS